MCMWEGCDEPYVIYRQPKATKAAKEHKCTECHRIIAKGETYYPSAGLYDGRWDAHHTCAHCHVACEWLIANCEGFLHHAVGEDIQEHAAEYNRFDLRLFHEKMYRKWQFRGRLRELPKLPRPIKVGDARVTV